jgi:chemotaxis protein CheC
MFTLSPLQNDALCEIFNISVGQAAATLSEIVNEKIVLSVPEIKFYTVSDAGNYLGHANQRICGIWQSFDGYFNGNALLIFPEARSLELVRLMMGKNIPIEQLTELEQDALSEIGNIILNSCLASLSELFDHPFQCGLPRLHIGSGHSTLKECDADHIVMILEIQFAIESKNINGYVVFVMNTESLDLLAQAIDHFLGSISN